MFIQSIQTNLFAKVSFKHSFFKNFIHLDTGQGNKN
jgi:hypothetical protein